MIPSQRTEHREILDSLADVCSVLIILILVITLLPAAMLRAQEAPAPAGEPVPANLTIEEQMRIRRAQQAEAAPPATRPVPGARSAARGGRATFGGGMPPDMGARGPQMPMAALGEGPTCTLDATIYDVRMPGNQIGRIDIDALTRASAMPETFEKVLVESLGPTTPLYRANQSVRLAGDSITIGTTTPYITNSVINAQGQAINTVSYSNVGALFRIAGKTGAAGSIELDLNISLSSLTEGTTPISPTVKASVFRTASMSRKGPVEASKPFVVVSVDAASTDTAGQAVAYIARITLGAPQPPAGSGRGE